MKNSFRSCIPALAVLAMLILPAGISSAAPRKTEGQLIEMLRSQNYKTVIDALDRVPDWYPHSTNAIPVIKEILIKRAPVISPYVSPNIVTRRAARALGDYHATLTSDELIVIYEFFMSHDPDSIMDGLKALRGMNAPEAVPQIVPMLKDPNDHVVRDSCRTLAVLGNKEIIPQIEPLLSHPSSSVRKDAKDAIAALKAKP
jgi:hypothetical protein